MPDMPPGQAPGAPAPQGQAPQGQPPQDVASAITLVDQTLTKLNQLASQSKLPDEIKAGLQQTLQTFRQVEQAMVKLAGGDAGGDQEPDEDDEGGSTTMEQGGQGGAVPLSHQNMRGK